MNYLDDDKFRKLVKEGKLEIPSPDFTEKLMNRVGEQPRLMPESYFQYDIVCLCSIVLLVLLGLYIVLDYSKIYISQQLHIDFKLISEFRTHIPFVIALLISVSCLMVFDNLYERKKMKSLA